MTSKMKDLPNLDLMRAIAVLSVLIEHVVLAYGIQRFHGLDMSWFGVVGVLLFFVHTSLVLMWSLERRPHTLDFYVRRLFRIYPLPIVVSLIALCFRVPVNGTPAHYFQFIPLQNVMQVFQSLSLLPGIFGGFPVMSVMWTLPVEIEMYAVLPLLFFFARKNFSVWPFLFLFAVASSLDHRLIHSGGMTLALASPFFIAGVIAYVGFGRTTAFLPAWTFGIMLVLVWAFSMRWTGLIHGYWVCLAVGVTLPWFHQIRIVWLKRCSHALAKYSYGIYLTHPFAIVLGIYLLPRRSYPLQLGIILVATAVFSVTAYHLLEEPLIRFGAKVAGYLQRWYDRLDAIEKRIPEGLIS